MSELLRICARCGRPRRPDQHVLTPGQVAALYNVNPKSVLRWEAAGDLTTVRTPGGHRRYPRVQFNALFCNPADNHLAPGPEDPR
jgi:hypothetical protein